MILFTRSIAIMLGLALSAAIAWAFSAAPFWPSVAHVTANAWGIVTLIDLYVGILLFGIVVLLVERRAGVALTLVLLAFVLGNLVFAAWVAWRLPKALRAPQPLP